MGKKLRRSVLTAVCVLGLLAAAGVSLYLAWEEPPTAPTEPAALPPSQTPGSPVPSTPRPPAAPEETGEPLHTARRDGVCTILLAGNDDGTGNTDTIMLGRIDTKARRMDFVSIPRDTYVDVPWEVKKLNSVYWTARNAGQSGIDALREQVRILSGVTPDCYAVLDLAVLEQAVDAMGGVWFDVPMDMDYDDPSQGLSIHLKQGPQKLSGEQAMGLCRYRSGYVTGDIGRIEMQQRFLRACAEQLTELGQIPNLKKVASILCDGVDTDLSAANVAWLLRQALRCRAEDLHFYTVPHTPYMIGGYSYAVVERRAWLQMIDEVLSPDGEPTEPESLQIMSYVPPDPGAEPVSARPPEEPEAPPEEPSVQGPRRIVVEVGTDS